MRVVIEFRLKDPFIRRVGPKWLVCHPSQPSIILARCDSEREAKRVRDAINDILRGVDEVVK